MIRSLYLPEKGLTPTTLTPPEFAQALQNPQSLLWVDFSHEQTDDCRAILLETFGFHPLAVNDALEERHVPKLDDWEHYLYIVLRAAIFNPQQNERLDMPELDVFLGQNYLVTHHRQDITAIEQVWQTCHHTDHLLQRGSSYLLYRIVEEIVIHYSRVVDDLDGSLDVIEDELFDNPTPLALENIFTLKRNLIYLRRIIVPQREVINQLAHDQFEMISETNRIFFRHVYDHLVRLSDIVESIRELVGIALNTYLSVVNNRMNDIVKTLTIITTIFMPLSFVVGFFGMNFFQATSLFEVWTGPTAFTLTLTFLALLPVGMYIWMRRRKWI